MFLKSSNPRAIVFRDLSNGVYIEGNSGVTILSIFYIFKFFSDPRVLFELEIKKILTNNTFFIDLSHGVHIQGGQGLGVGLGLGLA